MFAMVPRDRAVYMKKKLIHLRIKGFEWCNESNSEIYTKQADLFNLTSH